MRKIWEKEKDVIKTYWTKKLIEKILKIEPGSSLRVVHAFNCSIIILTPEGLDIKCRNNLETIPKWGELKK